MAAWSVPEKQRKITVNAAQAVPQQLSSGVLRCERRGSSVLLGCLPCLRCDGQGFSCWPPGLLVCLALSLLLFLGVPEAPLQLLGARIISKWQVLLKPAAIKAPYASINRGTASKLQPRMASCQKHAAASAQPQAGFAGKLQHKTMPLLLCLETSFWLRDFCFAAMCASWMSLGCLERG